MELVKRATIGQFVKADVTRKGDWLCGQITDFDKTHITFQPSDNGPEVVMARDCVFKSTREEFDAEIAGAERATEQIQQQPLDSDEKEAIAEIQADSGEYVMPEHCPHCGVHLSNGWGYHGQEVNDEIVKHKTNEFQCLGCGVEFGPAIEHVAVTIANPEIYKYEVVKAHSGKMSKDNGDVIARMLRGQPLDYAYDVAAEFLDVDVSVLKVKYAHLNAGHQRMCLGNLLRAKK